LDEGLSEEFPSPLPAKAAAVNMIGRKLEAQAFISERGGGGGRRRRKGACKWVFYKGMDHMSL
jgi:hypothetical protein